MALGAKVSERDYSAVELRRVRVGAQIPTSREGTNLASVSGPPELDDRSSQVPQFLRRPGVRREELVAICLERSPELVVALSMILNAGGFESGSERRIVGHFRDCFLKLILTL